MKRVWKWFTEESSSRGITIILVILSMAGGIYSYFKPQAATPTKIVPSSVPPALPAMTQSTTGSNSPIITSNSGSVSYWAGVPAGTSPNAMTKPAASSPRKQ